MNSIYIIITDNFLYIKCIILEYYFRYISLLIITINRLKYIIDSILCTQKPTDVFSLISISCQIINTYQWKALKTN